MASLQILFKVSFVNFPNQLSMVLENELNNARSALPVSMHTVHKLTMFAQNDKINAKYRFVSLAELRHFIELNQRPGMMYGHKPGNANSGAPVPEFPILKMGGSDPQWVQKDSS
jgi:hypothetical protein